MSLGIHVLMAGRTIYVPALMPLNSFYPYLLLSAGGASPAKKAHGGLWVGGGFARLVNSQMCLETSVSEKVAMTSVATLGRFEASWVSCLEIGAIFLTTGSAKSFFVASMPSLGVIGFPTVATHITGPEKPWQTGNDIVMAMVVEQNQWFVLGASKGGDMERAMGVHQNDLVIGKGRGGTEGRQGIVAARTQGHLGFVMEQQSHFFLDFPTVSNRFPFRVLV